MGMESVLVQATPSQLEEFQENLRFVYQYVTGDPGEGDEFAVWKRSLRRHSSEWYCCARASGGRKRVPHKGRDDYKTGTASGNTPIFLSFLSNCGSST